MKKPSKSMLSKAGKDLDHKITRKDQKSLGGRVLSEGRKSNGTKKRK